MEDSLAVEVDVFSGGSGGFSSGGSGGFASGGGGSDQGSLGGSSSGGGYGRKYAL